MSAAELETNTPTFRLDERLIAGRYRPQDRIGHGRLGEIFTAVDEGTDDAGAEQQLAIQIVPEKIVRNNKLFNKLNVGYSVLRAANRPNIVKYHHFGRHGKRGFLVMELLDGASLRSVLATAETLPPDEVKPVLRAVGGALQFLHAQDMLHGNVTAANVFFTETLDILLLDVLPLGADQAIIRGGATSSPFSRCTVRDDVFGLACLAYEMLAGRHPFDNSPAAEAASANLEPERIRSLSDSEWDALRRALAPDPDSRTATIAEFLREFGISGTERLEPTPAAPPQYEVQGFPVAEPMPPASEPPAPAARPESTTAAEDPVVVDVQEPRKARPAKRSGHSRRTLLLAVLLAALGTWAWLGQPRTQVTALVGQIETTVAAGLAELTGPAVEPGTVDPVRPYATEPVVSVDRPAATAVIAGDEAMPAELEVPESEPEPAATAAETPVAASEPPPDTAVIATSETLVDTAVVAVSEPAVDTAPAVTPEAGVATADEATALAADSASADADVEPAPAEPEAIFTNPVVTVSERDGAARIVVPTTGYSESPLIWWTSEHSASADEDFIRVEQTLVARAIIAEDNVLHVPIINDSLPEPPESFFVSLGFHDRQRNHIERIGTVRVDIVDDD